MVTVRRYLGLMMELNRLIDGLNTYSFKKLEKVICQRFQNSERLFEMYGLLKFSGVLIPMRYAVPIAMSEYPAKSK